MINLRGNFAKILPAPAKYNKQYFAKSEYAKPG
jgi:hypothetical protein